MGEAFSDPTQIFFKILQSNTKKLYRQLSQETPLSPIPASHYVIAGSQHFESHFWIFFFFKHFICQKMQGFSNGAYVTWSTPTLRANIGRHPSGHLEESIRMGMTIGGLVGSGSSLSFRDGAEGRNSGSRVWQGGPPRSPAHQVPGSAPEASSFPSTLLSSPRTILFPSKPASHWAREH